MLKYVKKKTEQNQNLYTLPSSIFDKKGIFAWPGTFDDSVDLLETIYHYESKAKLFYSIDFPSRIGNKIKNWSFLEICCSLYYFYLEKIIEQRQKRNDPPVSAQVWVTASTFILNPKISTGFSQFIRDLQIVDHSNKKDILRGIINHLMCVPSKNNTLFSKLGLDNLLTFVDIGDKKRENLVKKTFAGQNKRQLLKVLFELQKNNNSSFGSRSLTLFLRKVDLTSEQLQNVLKELSFILNERSLSNIEELSDFKPVDVLSSSDGFLEKIAVLDTSTYYTTLFSDILTNPESFSLEIFQLFENFLSQKFKNFTTFKEKQNFLNNIDSKDFDKLTNDFFESKEPFLSEQIKPFAINITPRNIIKNILFITALVLIVVQRSRQPPSRNQASFGNAPFASMTISRPSSRPVLTASRPVLTSSAASYSNQLLYPTNQQSTGKTETGTFNLKTQTDKVTMSNSRLGNKVVSSQNRKALIPDSRASKLKTLGGPTSSKTQKNRSEQTFSTSTPISIEQQVQSLVQLVKPLEGSSVTSDIQNIPNTNLVTATHTTGCYAHTQKMNTHVGDTLKANRERCPDLKLYAVEADHIQGREIAKGVGINEDSAATVCISSDIHKLKTNKTTGVDLTRSDNVITISGWMEENGERTIIFYDNLPADIAALNGIDKTKMPTCIQACVKHDKILFQKAGLDEMEGVIICDSSTIFRKSANGVNSFIEKVNKNASSLNPEKAQKVVLTTLQNAIPRGKAIYNSKLLVQQNPERLILPHTMFIDSMKNLISVTDAVCPDAIQNPQVKEGISNFYASLKGENAMPGREEELKLDLADQAKNQKAIISNNVSIIEDPQHQWWSENPKPPEMDPSIKDTSFKPPFQPPFS